MRKLLFVIPCMALLGACDTAEQRMVTGAAAGAALGAAVSDDRAKGAVIGGAAGLATAALIGEANQPGKCRYRNAAGQEFIADC